MGYYAELEIERSIAEGDYKTKAPSAKGMKRGVINYLYKKGFIKEEDRTTIINSYFEQILKSKLKKQQKQCVIIQENFGKFTTFVNKEYIQKRKNPQP